MAGKIHRGSSKELKLDIDDDKINTLAQLGMLAAQKSAAEATLDEGPNRTYWLSSGIYEIELIDEPLNVRGLMTGDVEIWASNYEFGVSTEDEFLIDTWGNVQPPEPHISIGISYYPFQRAPDVIYLHFLDRQGATRAHLEANYPWTRTADTKYLELIDVGALPGPMRFGIPDDFRNLRNYKPPKGREDTYPLHFAMTSNWYVFVPYSKSGGSHRRLWFSTPMMIRETKFDDHEVKLAAVHPRYDHSSRFTLQVIE